MVWNVELKEHTFIKLILKSDDPKKFKISRNSGISQYTVSQFVLQMSFSKIRFMFELQNKNKKRTFKMSSYYFSRNPAPSTYSTSVTALNPGLWFITVSIFVVANLFIS